MIEKIKNRDELFTFVSEKVATIYEKYLKDSRIISGNFESKSSSILDMLEKFEPSPGNSKRFKVGEVKYKEKTHIGFPTKKVSVYISLFPNIGMDGSHMDTYLLIESINEYTLKKEVNQYIGKVEFL